MQVLTSPFVRHRALCRTPIFESGVGHLECGRLRREVEVQQLSAIVSNCSYVLFCPLDKALLVFVVSLIG